MQDRQLGVNDLVLPKEQNAWIMRLTRFRDDEQGMEAPCSNEELTSIIFIDSVGVRRGKLHLGTGRPKELLGHLGAQSMGRHPLDAD